MVDWCKALRKQEPLNRMAYNDVTAQVRNKEMNNMEIDMYDAADQYELTMAAMVSKYERMFETTPRFDAMTSGKLQAYRDSLDIFREAFGR